MIKLLSSLLAARDVADHATSLRDLAQGKIARVRYVRDIVRDGDSALKLLNKARRFRASIKVGGK